MRPAALPALVTALACLCGCGGEEWEKERSEPDLGGGPYAETVAAWAAEPLTRGGIMMLGDSIVYGWPENYLPVTAKRRGICGDTTKGVLSRLWLVVEEVPDAVFLLIGVNNFLYGQIYEAPEDVGAILDELREKLPGAGLYLLSILPTSEADRPNRVIERINDQYRRVCSLHPPCQYIDLYSRMYLPGVGLPQSKDGLHPNAEGYEVMAEALAPYWGRYPPHLYPLIQSAGGE